MKAPKQERPSGMIPETINSDIRLMTISEDLENNFGISYLNSIQQKSTVEYIK